MKTLAQRVVQCYLAPIILIQHQYHHHLRSYTMKVSLTVGLLHCHVQLLQQLNPSSMSNLKAFAFCSELFPKSQTLLLLFLFYYRLKHHDIKSEYNEALEQLLKTNIIEIDHLNLCSDNIKEFYIHCQEMIDYIRKTIDHINNLQDQFTMDSSEEHSGLIIRTLFTLKLIMLTCKQLKNDAWFRRTMTVLNDCQELAQEAFNGFDKFSEDFGKEVKRLVNLADTLKQRDTFFEVNLELDEDMINEVIS